MPDQQFSIDAEPVYVFLDELQESAITNMLGAVPYIVEEFEIDKQEAKEFLHSWIDTYKERHPE